jgi:hypothetical protein
MSGSLGRSLRAVATMTVSLLIVVGPAAAAFADGGPDRVLPSGGITAPRPGFGDHILPSRPGFGDQIPAHDTDAAPAAPAVEMAAQPAGGGLSMGLSWLFAGVTIVAAAVAWAATVRRRRYRLA